MRGICGIGSTRRTNEDGNVTAVSAGTILNSGELRDRLERAGHRFGTHDDAEVVAHLYEQHGDAFAGLLRGPFAVAVRDDRARRVVLARDRFGLEPLVYRAGFDGLDFASDLQALPRGELDLDAVDAFLALGWIPAPLTIDRDVRKLPPGHLLVREDDGMHRLERFAPPALVPADELRSEDVAELAEELRSRVRDSVRTHLGDAPRAGVLHAGDVYSAAVAALAIQERTEPLRTFSSREPAGDAASLLRSLAEAFDEPLGDPSAAAAYLASERAAQQVDVALTGEGGAEVFGRPRRHELFTPEERAAVTGRRSAFEPPADFIPLLPRVPVLELRRPFLDTIVTNLALALAAPTKLLERALQPLLPRAVLRDRDVRLPIPAGLASLARERLARQELFQQEAVTRLIDEYDAGRKERARQLWALLAFAAWHERQPREASVSDLVADAP